MDIHAELAAVEDRRNDPLRRAAVRAHVEQKQAAYVHAQALVAEAARVLSAVDAGPVYDPIFMRGQQVVARAAMMLDRDAKLALAEPTETYIGNHAAMADGAR